MTACCNTDYQYLESNNKVEDGYIEWVHGKGATLVRRIDTESQWAVWYNKKHGTYPETDFVRLPKGEFIQFCKCCCHVKGSWVLH